VFFILIALAGVLALTFDYGFVLLARRQMQVGVSSAALEGLRGQGDPKYDDNNQLLRRNRAKTLLQLNFDDNFDLTENNTTIGAGIDSSLVNRVQPVNPSFEYQTELGDGSGTANLLANRANYIYRADDFELNVGSVSGTDPNEIQGDMVVGQYVGDPPQRGIECREGESLRLHEECFSYVRNDFRTSDESDFDPIDGENAFLVRMRRTPDPADEKPGVSSRGNGLPLMMGHLSWMNFEQPSGSHDIRRDGTIVRATSIAAARPIVCVFASSDPAVYPLLPYSVLTDGTWRDTTLEDLYTKNPAAPTVNLQPLRSGIGTEVSAGSTITEPTDLDGYVPLVINVDGADRIIGFRLFVTTGGRSRSDSPRLQDAWPSLPTDSEDRQAVIAANRNATFNLDAAPALVRTVR
jgi:hypothetical protein